LQHSQPRFIPRGVVTNKDYKTNSSKLITNNTSAFAVRQDGRKFFLYQTELYMVTQCL